LHGGRSALEESEIEDCEIEHALLALRSGCGEIVRAVDANRIGVTRYDPLFQPERVGVVVGDEQNGQLRKRLHLGLSAEGARVR